MAVELDRTCWRGMEIGHPVDWELSLASSLDSPGRCSFSDRYYQRLDVQWRPLTYVPQMDRMLDKYRARKEKKTTFHDAPHLPAEWHGLARKTAKAWILHAGRFFRERRLLVEVTILWPDKRDKAAERAILASIAAQDPDAPARTWRASGIEATISGDWELVSGSAQVGRVRWEFRPRKKRRGPRRAVLTVERIAAPRYWLDEPLRDWLTDQLPQYSRTIHRGGVQVNAHPGEQLTSRTRIATLPSLRGIRRLRLDVAWQCPIEDRVYHVSYSEPSRRDELVLPEHFQVRCCRPVRVAGSRQEGA